MRARVLHRIIGLAIFGVPAFVYLALMPRWVSPLPYVCSVPGPTITSAAGVSYRIAFNDAGAAHSGNHWVWVTSDRSFFRAVVAEGFVAPEVRYGEAPVALVKRNGETFILFCAGRYDSAEHLVKIP